MSAAYHSGGQQCYRLNLKELASIGGRAASGIAARVQACLAGEGNCLLRG
jgi:hypothetical protein